MFAGPQSDWRGPTSAPKPEAGKHVAYLSSNQQNDASREWGTHIQNVGEKIGWEVTIIDGRGSPVGWQEGLNQAIALKVDGIVMDADAASLQPQIKEAIAQGIVGRRHPRLRLPRPAAGSRPVRQHPAGSARHRPRAGRLDHRPLRAARRASWSPAIANTPSPAPRRTRPRSASRNAPAARCWNSPTRRSPRWRSASRRW